ncbi:aldehyde reductase [Trichoderma arundinaceum]|uniref:Aldehyde reductase n=1 Tax=Trichoderma arundinaceum TaxID=490622 RepID=A0A395NYX9_TRIAR|nr:aldehyde reductase [Trichoderma arundinaceum]
MSHLDSQFSIPTGSIVVVSGANGNIASHIADQLIKAGYVVRGTVRDVKKNDWLIDHFSNIYGPGKIELVEVPDMSVRGGFDEAVKGASGFIHTATPVMENADPNLAIPVVMEGTLNALKSAATEPKLKRFVLTSSSGACTAPKPGKMFTIDSNTWNEEAITAAWAPPPYEGFERLLDVYYASKTQGEKEAWKWVRDNSPNFVFNTVLPNANFGPVVDKHHQQYHSTLGWVRALWNGFQGEEDLRNQPPQYYINIVDDAIVHVAALLFKDVSNERLFTFAYPYNWNDILAIFRKLYPGREFIDDIPNLQRDLSVVTNGRAEDLLKRFAGHGWTNLEETIKTSIADY